MPPSAPSTRPAFGEVNTPGLPLPLPANRRERPWLVPYNRRLRHLHSITLRNLTLSEDHGRPRNRTIDDEGVPTSLKTPAKMLAMREKQLGHSKSSTDLRPIHETPSKLLKVDSSASPHVNGTAEAKSKPAPASSSSSTRPPYRLRRRSTMEWTGATSQQRQKKLEDVSATRMADIFFSLHVAGAQDPIYVSEVVEKAMNPNFNHVDLHACGPAVTRQQLLTVRFWTKSERSPTWHMLLDMTLSLRSLQFIGKTLASFHHPFPPNSVVFHLTDGFYTVFTDAPAMESKDPFADISPPKSTSSHTLPTSSFDALLRLSKLDDSIQDALALRRNLASQLEAVVQDHRSAFLNKGYVGEREDFLKTITYATTTIQQKLKTLGIRRDTKRAALLKRRALLADQRACQHSTSKAITASQPELQEMRNRQMQLSKDIAAQRRRICTDLSKIYPITPVPNRPLAFTIRALHLANSESLDSIPAEHVAAALGHVAHVLQLLSFYLGIVLPYPPQPRSSSSTILDPISTLSSTGPATSVNPLTTGKTGVERRFPLFAKSAVRFRFEYGVFLLNKDIEVLLSMAFGVRVLDIRQTLANLLYAVYCATAGEGELPARKAGGIRGLVRSGEGAASIGSRNGLGITESGISVFGSSRRVGRERERKAGGRN